MLRLTHVLLALGLLSPLSLATAQTDAVAAVQEKAALAPSFRQISIISADQLEITADLYMAHESKKAPFILLCHQASWSRGEYREIAPKLNALGFNCMAIDQRSGGGVNGVVNNTAARAEKAKYGTEYPDGEQDILAALNHVHAKYAKGPVLLWGSSYSSALVLRIGGERSPLVDGVLAFAPGEYFTRFGKPEDWITVSAKKLEVPVFITSAKNEHAAWKGIFEAIPSKTKMSFLPETKGNHGSRALWSKFDDSPAYWTAVETFLAQFVKRPVPSKTDAK